MFGRSALKTPTKIVRTQIERRPIKEEIKETTEEEEKTKELDCTFAVDSD